MREYLQMSKSKIIRTFLLLVVLFFIITYFYGKSVYDKKVRMMEMDRMGSIG